MKKKNELRIGESTRLNNDENDDVSISEEEVEKLEEEVKEIVKRVEASRSTFPNLLKSSLSSLLSLHSPPPPCGPHSDPGSSCGNSSTDLDINDGEQNPDEVKLLRDKISSNIDAIPKVLKRMNECISRVDRLVSSSETIHPVFKRKKS